MAPTLQTPPHAHYSSANSGAAAPAIPSIRLISATPSTNGHDDSITIASPPPPVPAMPWETNHPTSANTAPAPASKTLRSVRSVLKPKSSGKENRSVVPKKSKLGLLGGLGGNKDEKKAKDLSDVVRRMGISSASVSVNGIVVNQGTTRSKTSSVASKDSQTLALFRSSSNTSKEEKRASKTLKAQEKEAIKQNTLGKAGSVKLKGGFEIFVDPSYEDEEIGEILVVRKKKSRAGLDAVFGMDTGLASKGGALGEITNGSNRGRLESRGSVRGRAESGKYDKQDGGLLKPKEDDKKWWNLSIGRSRKDSKDERKEETAQDSLPMRSQTPDPFKPSSSEKESKAGRGRFNSLDAGMLLGLTSKKSNANLDGSLRAASPVPPPQRKGSMPMPSIIVAEPTTVDRDLKATRYEAMPPPPPMARSTSLPLGHDALLAYSAKASTPTTPTLQVPSTNGGLAPPVEEHMLGGKENQGSIALRAMRSVRSFARIGAWASGDAANDEGKKDGTVKEKKSKSKSSKKDKEAGEGEGTIRKKSKKDKKESKKEKKEASSKEEEKEVKSKQSAIRLSTSSFEAGALSSSPAPPPRSQSSLGIYGHKSSSPKSDGAVNPAYLSASNAYPDHETSTKQDKFASVGYGYDKNAAIGFDANTGNLTIGKSKGKKKKEKADKAKSSDDQTNKDTISKKHSILGLGLPSSMRIGGRGRQGSSASSIFNPDKVEGGKQFGATILPPAASTRLSVDSCAPVERRASINSTASSLRPISVTSSISGASTADSRRVSESSSLGVNSILARREHRTSTQSKVSTGAGSIRWDEGVLEREKEKIRRESLESATLMKRDSMDSRRTSAESTRSSRRSSMDPKQKEEGRRRTALTDVFPELNGSRRTSGLSDEEGVASGAASKRSSRSSTNRDGRFKYPILTIEEATNDGHSVDDHSLHGYDRGSGDYEYHFNSGQATFGAYDETRVEGDEIRAATSLGFAPADTSVDTVTTPLKKARQRPRSEQLLGAFGKSRSLGPASVLGGSSRPGALYEDDDGVLSVLSAATNDLEKLIDVLGLEATPCTPDLTPLKPSLSPYASEPSSVVSARFLHASLASMDRMSSIASLRAYAAASAAKDGVPSATKANKENDGTRTHSTKTKTNPKSLSKSKQIKAMCNASPTAKKSTGVNSVLTLGSTNAANATTIRASGGVKAMVARLNEQSSHSQLTSLFNPATQRKTSTSSQLTCRSSVSSLNSVAGSVRLGPYKQSRKLSTGPSGGLAGLFAGSTPANMSKVEEGSHELDEDDIVAEVMKAAESKVKRDEEERKKAEEKRKVEEKKKIEEIERQKALEEENEKSRSPSMFARKNRHKRTMTPGPEPEPAPVFQPLQLPRRNNRANAPAPKDQDLLSVRPLAIRKLSKESPIRLKDAFCDDSGDEEDKFKTVRGSKGSDLFGTVRSSKNAKASEVEHKEPITKEARRMLGRSLGGSDVSAYRVELDESDPDSDVPEELRVILRKDDKAVKAYGTGRSARVIEQEEETFSDEEDVGQSGHDDDDDDFENDGEGYTINRDDMTMDVTTDEWSVEVPRSAPAVFTQQPVFSPSRLGVKPVDSPLRSSTGLGNSVGLSSSMASVATVRHASVQRLPVFRAQLVPDTIITAPSSAPATTTTYPAHQVTSIKHLSASYSSNSSDGHGNDLENTKTSFDFTGEYARLNQSGDRLSFVEQLESAFKTPAKVDLDFNSDMFKIGFGIDDAPPVPDLPRSLMKRMTYEDSIIEETIESSTEESVEDSMEEFKLKIGSRQVASDATFLSVANTSINASNAHTTGFLADDDYTADSQADLSISELTVPVLSPNGSANNIKKQSSRIDILKASGSSLKVKNDLKSSTRSKSNSVSSSRSRASNGELNRSFRFGGLSSSQGSSSSPLEPAANKDHSESKVELTLSDIIPSPRHAREISFHSSMLDEYEDSGLKSMLSKDDELLSKELPPLPASIAPQAMTNQEDDVFSEPSRDHKRISFVPLTRPSSNVSFGGLDSFDEVRRGFEFHDYRPDFYPSTATALPTGPSGGRYSHRKAQDSVWSIASVSSYGHVLRDGAADPFDYGMAPPVPPLPEHLRQHNRMISEVASMEGSMEGTDYTDSMSFEMSTAVDDTFSFIRNRPARRRVDSDASSFYFTHRRRESNWSVTSIPGLPGMPPPPPVSMFTRGHHRKTSSVTSASSIAMSYAMHGAMGGRAILARHRRDASMDSMMMSEEDRSMHRRSFARPGLGDKMFETSANYLDAIAGSPSGSIDVNFANAADETSNRDSEGSFDYYDSILDNTQHEHAERVVVSPFEQPSTSIIEDSLFDKTGVRSEESSDCVFGDSNENTNKAGRLPPAQFRPLSLISNQSVHDPMHEDDTMISMIGGGHVRRLSVGSQIEASPCVRIEKRRPRQRHRATARMVYQGTQLVRIDPQGNEVSNIKAGTKLHNIVEKPSIASSSSMTFGGNRMGSARRGLLERQSLEDSCLMAEGEDTSLSYEAVPVFTRPMRAGRQRSSTQSSCTTSESSGVDTPPLSPSDGSMSGGSMSSIDLLDLGSSLSNTTNPVSSLAAARNRAIASGSGHRRRYSKAQRMSISRASTYETIEEESNASSSECDTPNRSITASITQKVNTSIHEEPTAIYVVDSDSQSIISVDQETSWDDERGIVAMRKFYTLKDEAHVTVEESRRQWEDTPFSVYAVQSFNPPRNPDGMKALLEQSVRNYIPLPAELRRIRSRKGSRPSPYPQTRTFPTSTTSINSPPIIAMPSPASFKAKVTAAAAPLQQRSVNTLGASPARSVSRFKLGSIKPMSPFVVPVEDSPMKATKKKTSNGTSDGSFVRPRVPSAVRRSALGWTKRSNGPKSSMENKENAGQGLASTPGDNLRINRPRPRAGRTPGSQARPIRV